MDSIPVILKGKHHIDERGKLSFVNNFKFDNVIRFYTIENKNAGEFRGWHGHKKEGKYIFVAKGKAHIFAVKVNDWKNPSKRLKIWKFMISEESHDVLYIPPGYANGFKIMKKDTKVTFFSTLNLEDSKNDDIRFSPSYWKI